MDIWNILGIAPTTDKKIIKKAYAAKIREFHPEEKPEEFRQLHDAYRAALEYEPFISQENLFPDSGMEIGTTEYSAAENTTESAAESIDEELLFVFADNQERSRQRVDAFTRYWKEFESPYHNPEVLDWWKAYLFSEEFQEIRYHSQVLHLLAEEMDDKFFYGIHEVKLLFWDAYGFQEDEATVYQGDQQRLWRCLYPAYAKQQKKRQDERSQAKYYKAIHIFVGAAIAVILLLCILTSVSIHKQREKGRLFLIEYMAQHYPETVFSEPERLEKDSYGNIVYTMRSSAHPELSVTAKVEYQYVEGQKAYLVTEDYGQLLFEYYAAQYGLEAGQVTYTTGPVANPDTSEYSALFYSDIEQIDEFCETVEQMFREQEELQTITNTAICTEGVLFPEILFQGGVEKFSFAGLQVYDLGTTEASELSAALQEAYMIYMFQYESWNITPRQYREWGAAYERICKEWENDDGEWHEVYDPNTGEFLCRLFISTYENLDRYYSGEGINLPIYTRMITVGNAYYFLQDREADLHVEGDGSGFDVNFYGVITSFGREPEVEFNDLRNYY